MSSSPFDAASFSDDTSLPYARLHVSIHAQIIREHHPTWYFFLRDRSPHASGEFKESVVATFFSLAEFERDRLLKTLRTVRIHIVDPRTYTVAVEDAVRRHLPQGTSTIGFLKRLDASTRHLARVRDASLKFVAESMLRDLPSERLLQEYRAWERQTGLQIDCDDEWPSPVAPRPSASVSPPSFDLTPFQRRKANVLRDIANFASASASVFSHASDEFRKAQHDPYLASPMAGAWLLRSVLGRSHAFDEGHTDRIGWIEEQRARILEQIDQRGLFLQSAPPSPLREFASADSVHIQAADIAATIARELWQRNSLPHLVHRFEYVTFNGTRLTEQQAETYERAITSGNLTN